jgi:HD superfamily phosphohydrolase
MYHDVYFHKTSLGATILVEEMLRAANEDLNLAERTRDLDQYIYVNEFTLIGEIMSKLPEEHPVKQLCKRLLLRDLPKLKVDTTAHVSEEHSARDLSESEGEFKFIKTRPFTGIDPVKFDQYNIRFQDKETLKLSTCKEMLEKDHYVPVVPYYIVRGYKL